ncbi:MAG: phosphoribosylformylglycinamidine synthase, partial [Christensenellales bacterium]
MGNVRRVYVEKKKGFDVEAAGLLADLRTQFGYTSLQNIRILVRYDIEGIDDETFNKALTTIFSEPAADIVTDVLPAGGVVFAVEYLPGQYDQRADSAAQCVAMLAQGDAPLVRCAKVYILEGSLDEEQIAAVKAYLINPVDSREASLDMPDSLDMMADLPPDVPVLTGFSSLDRERMAEFRSRYALAMTLEDAMFVAAYFRSQRRDPTLTELRVIDTYWSDHCRHTTFLTRLSGVQFDDSPLLGQARAAWREYIRARAEVYGAGREAKTMCLMDLAQMGMKLLRKRGLLDDLDESEEINACSIRVTVEVDGRPEDWLILFKNETHNHPTEIEPFGGAATCLGGAIRDPLSGRAYVYQAMRVTGSGDPRTPISETLPGKLPQRVLAIGAAQGFSSYGNQVGLATGQVTEIYDPGYVAKRLEIGALVGAAPARNVVRRRPAPGDQVVMLGGRTGRDGCGGATGSSKAHDINSTLTCGAEVQKGNPPTERKLQRLFRNPAASRLIKRCNDFGAGGVCVAIGELAPGLLINLDAVPLKYEGLDGTELAISESQERMAVVLDPADTQAFLELARQENLEATVVAEVTREPRMRMVWRGREIVNIERSFLDTNGVIQQAEARITAPGEEADPFAEDPGAPDRERWLACVSSLACCSQRGLAERFDSTIGAGTVLMPFGGARQLTPAQAMAARLPVPSGETDAGTLMAFGFDPEISRWSPFHGGVWAVVESVNRIACAGGDASACRLTLQEYFERMFRGPERWGKPLSALLGAFWAQCRLGVPAIGGKDSMSGTFEDLDVPPTLVSFALAPADMSRVISAEWKGPGHRLAVLHLPIAQDRMPDPDAFLRNCAALYEAIGCGAVLSAHTLGRRGLVPALSAMALGNWIGARIDRVDLLSRPVPGGALVELSDDADVEQLFRGCSLTIIGVTDSLPVIRSGDIAVTLREIRSASERALADVFPITAGEDARTYPCTHYEKR